MWYYCNVGLWTWWEWILILTTLSSFGALMLLASSLLLWSPLIVQYSTAICLAYKYTVFVNFSIRCGVIFISCDSFVHFAIISNIWWHLVTDCCIMLKDVWWSINLLVALAKVEAVTGQTPTLPVMKSEQKPPALTADALKLSHEVEPQAEVKPVTQLVQSVCVCVNSLSILRIASAWCTWSREWVIQFLPMRFDSIQWKIFAFNTDTI